MSPAPLNPEAKELAKVLSTRELVTLTLRIVASPKLAWFVSTRNGFAKAKSSPLLVATAKSFAAVRRG